MEEDQEFKHVCKFCNKNFPCGRSLGGHMRSHLINNNNNNNSNSAENDEKLIIISSSSRSNNKLSSLNNGGIKISTASPSPPPTTACFEAGGVLNPGYGLRENPRKTWRISDSSTEDTNSLPDKFCKECGKAFQSWKALFGHMKCHSEKERISNSFEEQDSWTSGGNQQKLVMDSQSDNETATAPNRRRRSRRRTTRYLGTANSSSFSTIPNASSSANSDADEQEQEEIAVCLMMLSRDVGHWGGSGGLKSVADSSDNSSVFLETTPISKTSRITIFDAKETAPKLKKLLNGREPGKSTEFCGVSSGFRKNLSRMNRTGSSIDGFFKKSKIIKKSKIDGNEAYFGKESELDEAKLNNSSKRKIHDDDCEPELRSDSLKKLTNNGSEISQRRSKFECTTCNKIFHSYQALGGHRASHKKIKGCFASKIDSRENSIETDISPEPIIAAESKPIKNCKIENKSIDHEMADQTSVIRSKKISKGHECPICLKVFSSGQALGGHKRSHLIGGGGGGGGCSEARNSQTIVIQKPIPEIRDFLDLNLPAPVEEENNNNGGHVASLKPWWVGNCSHKHEGLVGLISN